jgi:hypothetical protein
MAERFEGAAVWCATTGRAEYAGGQSAEPPAPGGEPAIWTLDLYDHDKGFTIAPPNGG